MSAVRYVGRCTSCGAARSVGVAAAALPGAQQGLFGAAPAAASSSWSVPCSCGAVARLALVVAVGKGRHVCDPRCWNAVGVQCDCSCGGKHHGAGHEDRIVMISG